MRLVLIAWLGMGLIIGEVGARGGEWPTWRADAARSGTVTEAVPENLHLQWVREYASPTDAWRDDKTLQFAPQYHPVAADGKLFVPSMIHDCVQALNADTGEVVWTAYAGGPIRFAPVYGKGKLYYASDDGNLYCVEAKSGKAVWTFNGAPRKRMVVGNDRLISTWPVRGGPVLKDGRIYFANGVWPFMGIFVTCLNADTGEVVWVNDGTLEDGTSRDQRVMHRPYEACPGGYLTIADDKLLLPAGRVWPSCYDLKTGKRVLYAYRLPIGALKAPGSSTGVIAGNGYWFVACRYARTWSSVCDPRRGGELVAHISGFPAIDGNMVYASRSRELHAYDFSGKTFEKFYHPGEFSVMGREPAEPFPASWKTQGAKAQHDPVKIGNYLFYGAWLSSGKRGGTSQLSAVRIPSAGGNPETVWRTTVAGQDPVVLAAGGKLFVTTSSGDMMCFAGKSGEVRRWPLVGSQLEKTPASPGRVPALIAKGGGDSNGYALVLGIGSGKWIESLLSETNRYVVVLDPDVGKVDAFRRKMHTAGLYGVRVMAIVGDIRTAGFPPCFAGLIVFGQPGLPGDRAVIPAAFRSLRPFGGRLCLELDAAGHGRFEAAYAVARLEGSKLTREGRLSVLTRGQRPMSAGSWQNAYGGDAAKTLAIQDAQIKAPLGLLWFGGDASGNIYGRLGPGFILCSDGGRVFTFDAKRVYALDAYTGRMLWSVPGAGYVREDKKRGLAGFSPAVDTTGLYISNGRTIVEYVPSTGKVSRQFPVPAEWGLGPVGNIILQDACLLLHSETGLVCVSRKDGRALWTRKVADKKTLSRIAVGGDHVFFAEGIGKKTANGPAISGELLSVDLHDGRVAWRVPLDGFPSGILYSGKTGLVLASWVTGLTDARSVKDGRRVWTGNPVRRGGWWNPSMPVGWNGRLILSGGQIVDIADGKPAAASHPLTGLPVPSTLPYKGFGCSMPSVVGDLLFSRGLDMVYYDLANDGAMARLDGSRLACGWSVMPCSGVLAVLNGQQFDMCRCRNPIASPMGLVHDPDVDLWTIAQFDSPKKGPVMRAGINLGAPGNRRIPDGTLWMDYPVVAFPPFKGEKTPPDLTKLASSDPHLPVEVTPSSVEWFRHHSLRVKGVGLKWVAASGAKGIRSIRITVPAPAVEACTVRLVFIEPDPITAGERVFDVVIQGKRVVEKLDIVAAAGTPMTVLTREFKGIRPGAMLTVELIPAKGTPVLCGVELVTE